jgi:hypothetical protein
MAVFCGPEVSPWITREDVKANPDCFFVFGDNVQRLGLGGQAAAMRGEPQRHRCCDEVEALPTSQSAFFYDSEYAQVTALIEEDLKKVEKALKRSFVVLPKDGLGTGLSRLPELAPRVNMYLEMRLTEMGWKKGVKGVWTTA